MPRLALARLILPLAGVLFLAACSPPAEPPPLRDIVLVTVDTLRADRMSVYGHDRDTTPELGRWFADGTIFERAYATETTTTPSIVSLLTGLSPQEHRVRLLHQLLPNGTKLLSDHLPPTYQRAAFVSNVVLTDEATGMAAHFDHYDDYVDESAVASVEWLFERNARRTTDAALQWLRTSRDPSRPVFLWVHYMDPHGPYTPPPDWKRTFEHTGRQEVDEWRMAPYQVLPRISDALDYVDLYDEEIAYADAHIGRLFDGYASMAEADEALLVVTSDHGEILTERSRWFVHGVHVYEELSRIPLLVRGPGFAATRRADVVSLRDFVPTVLDLLGQPVPDDVDGSDLRTPADAGHVAFVEGGDYRRQWRAAISGDTKYLVGLRPADGSPLERYVVDLASDPAEKKRGPWPEGDPVARRLLSLAADDPDRGGRPAHLIEGKKLSAPKVDPRAGPEDLRRLRALGYVE